MAATANRQNLTCQAFGVASLPLGVPVELELIFEVAE